MEKNTLFILMFSALSSVSAYASREYYYVNATVTWSEAQSYCREHFHDLATIDADHDNQRLLALARGSHASGFIWIGLYDDITIWKWSGEEKNFDLATGANFLTWLPGQPNNKEGKQYCVVYYNDSQRINDLDCGESHPFFCCEDNSTRNYVLVKQQLSWPEARRYCREHHGGLASIQSRDNNNNILSALTASGVANAWTGLYRDPWAFWSDKSTSTFTNWNPGEPNNMASEYCAAFNGISGKWVDYNCGWRAPFFCFKGVTSQTVLKLEMESAAPLLSADHQRQLLRQGRVAQSGVTNINILRRNVRSRHSGKDDAGCSSSYTEEVGSGLN